jgi:hypothetical protein
MYSFDGFAGANGEALGVGAGGWTIARSTGTLLRPLHCAKALLIKLRPKMRTTAKTIRF